MIREMDWEEKALALNSLDRLEIKMRGQGDWYCTIPNAEIGGNGMLLGSYGNGVTPVSAIHDCWDAFVTNLASDKFIVLNAFDDKRRSHVRWNGFMWEKV
jgi:hypothetical protein